MPIPGLRRVQFALDCDCGFTVEGADGDELLAELRAHIATAHEDGFRRDLTEMLIAAYQA